MVKTANSDWMEGNNDFNDDDDGQSKKENFKTRKG